MKMANKEVFGFNMLGPLRAGDIAIFSQRKGTHVILVDDVGFNFVALGFEELACPKDITDFVIQANDLAFARTFRWNFLFCRRTSGSAVPKREDGASVSLAIVMKLMRSIDIPSNIGEGLCKKGES
jgi:hypothetical protein